MRVMPMLSERRVYAALGDSMSIDDYAGGPGCGAASLLYRNRGVDFPEWEGRDVKSRLSGASFLPLPMDGATSATVRYAQIPRLKESRERPVVVTLTMGGNDLLQTFGDDHAADAAHSALAANGRIILDDLRRLAQPDAAILLNTIYDPSDGTGDTGQLGILAWPRVLEWIDRFNDTLRTLSDEFCVNLIDLKEQFRGHGLSAGNPAQGDARPDNRDLYYCGVVEPNAWGANAIRSAWWDAIVAAGVIVEENG